MCDYIAPAHENPLAAAFEVSVPGSWLTDRHIDHAQHLLGHNFPSLSGFQSTIIFASKNSMHIKVPTKKFVQIMNVNKNHWVTVSDIGCPENSIKVYDSLLTSGLQTNNVFNSQVASLLNTKSEPISVMFRNTTLQKGSSECGLFAIASATSLCLGMDPEKQNYSQDHMRDHLANCFINGAMTPFPVVA